MTYFMLISILYYYQPNAIFNCIANESSCEILKLIPQARCKSNPWLFFGLTTMENNGRLWRTKGKCINKAAVKRLILRFKRTLDIIVPNDGASDGPNLHQSQLFTDTRVPP